MPYGQLGGIVSVIQDPNMITDAFHDNKCCFVMMIELKWCHNILSFTNRLYKSVQTNAAVASCSDENDAKTSRKISAGSSLRKSVNDFIFV